MKNTKKRNCLLLKEIAPYFKYILVQHTHVKNYLGS